MLQWTPRRSFFSVSAANPTLSQNMNHRLATTGGVKCSDHSEALTHNPQLVLTIGHLQFVFQ